MSRSRARVAIVGAGHIARRHAAVIAQLASAQAGEVEIAGVADIVPEAAACLAGELQCPAFADSTALLDAASPDLVLIATPPAQHAHDIEACLRRGVDVLCEKPLVTDMRSLESVERLHRAGGPRVAMASKYRHARDVREARRLLAAGAIGDLLEVQITFARPVDLSGRWHTHRATSGGGVLMDNGPHAIDLARCFLGPIACASAQLGHPDNAPQVEQDVLLTVRNARGVAARAHLSWVRTGAAESFAVLRGSSGTVELGWGASRVRTGARSVVFGHGFDAQEALRAQLSNLLRARIGLEPLEMAAEDAFATVRVIDAAYRSLARGGSLQVAG